MNSTYKNALEKNIGKYSWYKIFTKRVYLPLIALQLVNEGAVTVSQIAIIAAITSLVSLFLQIPAGYIADKKGNRFAIVLGSSISVWSPLFYIFMPNFWGGLIASLLFFGGYAFQSGAIEAFMHDTLKALGRVDSYTKVMGRAQSYGLIGNVILITVIPATYVINNNIPFILGFISLLVMLILAINFTYPKVDGYKVKKMNPIDALRRIVSWQNIVIFIFAGFMIGVSNKAFEFRELLFNDIGINPAWFGAIIAVSSIVGAVMGWYIQVFDILSSARFYLFDLVYLSFTLIVMGMTQNYVVVITAAILFTAYNRVRIITVQAKLLQTFEHHYKATMLSSLSAFSALGDIIAVTMLSASIITFGYSRGYVIYGLSVAVIGIILWFAYLLEAQMRNHRV